ncbi:peptidoglycan recognition protein [Streptomyces griseus]|uniref:peptidoglycan recognition protein family protein n=1 Tax=Streptomyces griseus TaxID=1911 RepID=UPI0004CBE260|nr:peptidoglycan recognition protein [Streptomyces griseus]
MRASLASSVAVACAAALALPVTLAVPATATARPAATGRPAGPGALPPGPDAPPPGRDEPSPDGDGLPGSTRSLPLRPLGSSVRTFGADPGAAPEQGLARRDVSPFSLVGVVWDDPAAVLHGTVQVRTRAAADGVWSPWQDVETHNEEHGADPGTVEGAAGTLRGSTAPLWVGDSDGVEIRVRAETTDTGTDRVRLPAGLRLELVDPGEAPADPAPRTRVMAPPAALTAAEAAASAANGRWAPAGATVIPAETAAETAAQTAAEAAAPAAGTTAAAAKKPYIGPRPRIITRKGWGADERLREKDFVYTKTIKAAFVHHTATGNNYRCGQAPSVLRGIYRYHVKSSGWRDFGYNFAVDRCGNIYEGRAGGVARPVLGAHTLGFNTNSMGIAVLGSFGGSTPPAAAVTAVARLTAWKLGLHGVNPKGTQTLVSGGGNRYKKGRKVAFHAIAGHRDGFATECPGSRLYGKLGTARASSAKYQGRR